MKNKSIEFIYFDVGGVVILDYSKTDKWDQMLTNLTIEGKDREKFEQLFDQYVPKICEGRDLENFVEEARKKLNVIFPDKYSMLEDFVNRFEPNLSIHPILEKLKEKYRVGLLTNMYPGMLDLIKHKNLLPDIQWDVVIDSSIEGCSKPNDAIYEIAEKRAGVNLSTILLVENTDEHINAAHRRGWKTLLYDPSDTDKSNKLLENEL